jgi:uncharacterized membrane protein YdjX (TVP38/TMEM64 family)
MPRSTAIRLFTLILLILLAIAAAILLFATEAGHNLRHHPDTLRHWLQNHRLLLGLSFIFAYILVGAVAMPVWWLQILSGYCFGLIPGILMTALSSTLAAIATRNLSHWLGGGYVHDKLEARRARLRQLDEKLGHNGLLVVMATRLSHVIPFGLSNYLFGLSRISTLDVAIGSFLGGMPAASLYATLGADRHLLKDWRFDLSLICVNLLLLLPLLLRYLQPHWFKRIGVE